MQKISEKVKEGFLAMLLPTIFFFVTVHIITVVHLLMAKGTNFQPLTV